MATKKRWLQMQTYSIFSTTPNELSPVVVARIPDNRKRYTDMLERLMQVCSHRYAGHVRITNV
jgi:hypothetical protein